ncbi:hypothetical protein BD311DRAFT_759066 [Dichomitus squalens]|uniref:Uncharacterized protein n=1 Tax=Dichomitus squalens TaxID=114155 RepID=A0A4Q9MKR5_9APHY|nr:hypothetical protein BD311DRAFT_759066 [Dichomitus squalens]
MEDIPLNSAQSKANETVLQSVAELYNDRCALCPWRDEKHKIYRVLFDNARGKSQIQWLKEANIATLAVDSPDTLFPLCDKHIEDLLEVKYVLCPPIMDLESLLQFEKDDWNKRIAEGTLRDRRIPSIKDLSGKLSLIWVSQSTSETADILDLSFWLTGLGSPQPSDDSDEPLPCVLSPTCPHQVLFDMRARSRSVGMLKTHIIPNNPNPGCTLEICIDFNHTRKKKFVQRINPYAFLVQAMATLGNASMPAELYFIPNTASGSMQPIYVENPVSKVHSLLWELRNAYSRTREDCMKDRELFQKGEHPLQSNSAM